MNPRGANPTAGSAEPNWFEWQTGLLSLVEMLDENSEIRAVAFQLHGTKGWDDVGVRFRDGRTQLMQMKHSRSGDALTFGDLIAEGENHSPSLLRALAGAWKEEHKARGNVVCVLVTNRPAGQNWYKDRPPLSVFFSKIKERITHAGAFEDVNWDGEDGRYPGAWKLFITELSDLDRPEQLAFLQSLELQTSAPDLATLEVLLYDRLAALTGLPRSSVTTLFNTLHAHLRRWTCHSRRDAEWLDRESLHACLAGDEVAPLWLGHCEMETPEPFFPSRIQVVDSLRASLLSDSAHKVEFLSAEPGAGKTSCTSKLARSGAVRWQDQCVSIRFYTYRPIRPGQTDTGSDADGVCAEALWLGLLWQIRDHLRKTHLLTELIVPVWLYGMPWEVARGHVLRLANALGQRWSRPFIVCIDGIDHAARAQRKQLPEFLGTLPTPEAIPAHVRFFLAGQPAESYPEYPFFLRHPHVAVTVHSLKELADEDLRLLWRAAQPRMTAQAEDAVLRLLAEKTRRRTLPAVYAVEDIRDSATLEAASAILDARPLPDSLHNYYDAIWSAAAVTSGDSHRIAAAFAMLRERPTVELMVSAFSDIGKSAPDWRDILRGLRPLVRETAQGFELVHNDLRVHLDARLAGDPFARRDAASALAFHYRKTISNRLAAHRSLLDLLVVADRETDFADDFTVDWVIEAGALGIAAETLPRECSAAFRAAIARRDWLLLHGVGCAALTLRRLHECVTEWSRDDDPLDTSEVPTFLPVEGEPRPLELWTVGDFSELVAACEYLADRCEPQRASVVLKQWIGGIPLETLVGKVVAAGASERQQTNSGDAFRRLFERFGRLCAIYGVPITALESAPNENSAYFAAVEIGWAEGLAERSHRHSALRLWCSRPPRFLAPWTAAVRAAAAHSRWGEVRALLHRIHPRDLESSDRFLFGWYAARAKPANMELWSQPFAQTDYGLAAGHTSLAIGRIVAQWATYTNPLREPAQIADELFPLLDLRGMGSKNPAAVRLLLRGSAVVGRMLRYRDQNDFEGVAVAVPPAALSPYLKALWCCQPDWHNLPHEEVQTPGEIGRTLAHIAWECGPHYRQLLLDLAATRFSDVISDRDGGRVFDMLWEFGERTMLAETVTAKAREVLAHLHEHEVSSRNAAVANLVYFLRRLEIPELNAQLSARLGGTRIGYGCHKEWVFQPLVRWFQMLRNQSPSLWKAEGMQLLALDRIAEQQGADNRFSDELTAEIGAAAMAGGPDDFEALFGFLADREAKYPLWDLAKAAQDGFEICLREGHAMSEESVLARAAIAIALGRWPSESSLSTVGALLSAYGVPSECAQLPAWQQAVSVAAEIQGLPSPIIQDKGEQAEAGEPQEMRSAEDIFAEILQPTVSSSRLLQDVAALAEQAKAENHPNREQLIVTALSVVDSADAFSRYIEFDDIRLMSRLHANLTESEFWRLLGVITAITGDIRAELDHAHWAFSVAFSAANLACRARAAAAGHDFTLTIFRQLLTMHWKWHGVPPSSAVLGPHSTPSTWSDAARRILLSLTQTDGCETLYMVLSGVRFFAAIFPDQIPALCREGLAEEKAIDALLPLAQLWATRQPDALAPVLAEFEARETTGTLDQRLDAWAVRALHRLSIHERPRDFLLPANDDSPEIAFPGDGQLFETDAEKDGLMRHNSFAGMANKRLHRVGRILGSMESAFRHLSREIRESSEPVPGFYLSATKRLAWNSDYPRICKRAEHFVSNAILHQCAGQVWSPARATAVRLTLGYGMDPWIASSTPNPWPDMSLWPSQREIERWIEIGAPKSAEVSLQITALLEGHDLGKDSLLLGAVLNLPTYKHDLEFRLWLTAPIQGHDQLEDVMSTTPSGRTLAGWLAGWSFAATPRPATVTVHFVGDLVNYPNSNLSLTPTNDWTLEWGWRLDPENALRFRSHNGTPAAWHERWIGANEHPRRAHRQPILQRWIANRESLPAGALRGWQSKIRFTSGLLSRPE
jgi:hypothetical protein